MSTKYTTSLDSLRKTNSANSTVRSTNAILRGGNVIAKSEIDRIRASVIEPEYIHEEERRAYLKNLSNERVKHWPNTLEALRNKKESFIKDKNEREELERQEIDRQVSFNC